MSPEEQALEQFLARRGELSRRYREARGEGAPPELEARVMAQARAWLQRAPERMERWRQWGGPLSLAASLVLVISLAWVAQRQPLPQRTDAMAPAPPPSAPDRPAAQPQKPPPPLEQRRPSGLVPPPVLAEGAPTPDTAPTPAVQARMAAQRASPRQKLSVELAAPSVAVAPPPNAPAAAAPVVSAPIVSTAGAYAPAAEVPAPLPPAPVPMPSVSPPAAFTSAPAPAMPASAAAADKARTAPPDPCALIPGASAESLRDADAAAWLQRIRRLRDAPDLPAARRELACFGSLHSADQVPDDLKPLLRDVLGP
jgi:hypothetical protein